MVGLSYLKNHEPIGCRDKYTMENLLKHGINAYFSDCITLSLALIKRYAKAEMVVTSRIHCALPCLGLDTPVLFVDDKASPDYHRCRFDGLIELFNVVEYSEGMLDASKLSCDNKRKISQNNMPKNKDLWRPIANNIITLCKTWMTSDIEHTDK